MAKIQVPGAAAEVENGDSSGMDVDTRDEKVLQVTASALRQLMAEAQAPLLARIASLESTPRRAVEARGAIDVASLPDQSAIDPDKINTPVLSKQGWVVPTKFGSHPNQPK